MYQQLIEQIKLKIMSGDWPPGFLLPSIRELAACSQVSVITVKRAYQELEQAQLIVTKQGRGCYVTDSSEQLLQRGFEELDIQINKLIESAGQLSLSLPELLHRVQQAANSTTEEE